MKFRKKKLNSKGFSLIELLIVVAIMAVVILSLVALYSTGQRYFLTESTRAEMLQSSRQVLIWISRDIKEGIAVLPNWGSYTTSTNCLVLELPSIDANGLIIDIENNFDYIIYRLNPSDNRVLERIVDALDGVSSRTDSSRVLAKRVNSFVLSSEGVELSSIGDKSTISNIDIVLTTSQAIFGRTYQESLKTEVKLRNK